MKSMNTNRIINGDSFEELQKLPENSVHACVTDPPYGLAFMGKSWDDFEPKEYQEWCQEWAEHILRVLKPGGHILAFSGNRTHHRLFTGVEDAGFEIRDTLTWHYGSGFPKASDIGKTIDKRADAEREVVGAREADDVTSGNYGQGDSIDDEKQGERTTYEYTAPATDAAKKWDGWKTGLKPATEYVVMARKPFDGATVDCVLEHGTGALNIEGCRVENDIDEATTTTRTSERNQNAYGEAEQSNIASASPDGRYPSNVIFDETEAERLDEQVGECETGDTTGNSQLFSTTGSHEGYKSDAHQGYDIDERGYEDVQNGPSRYFYTSKASKAERTEDGSIDNAHPTVKPQDLMEWLIKLASREEQIVIDPFTGSGTTCKAAKSLNREFIGIEKQSKWADVARVRVGLTPKDPSVVRSNDNQQGLEQYE